MYKNITIKKKGGGTRKQRVQVLKSGKYKFVKNPTRSKSKTSRRSKTSKPKRSNRKVVKRRRSRSVFSTRTVEKFAKIAALAAPGVGQALRKDRDAAGKVDEILYRYTGYKAWDARSGAAFPFDLQGLGEGYLPYIATSLVWKGIHLINKILSGF